MSKWIEENNDHILEGHGAKFVVGHVLYSKQLPPKWTIKKSPFLLDFHKKFATLGEAKEYCEQRYQELFGKLDEITRLRADLAAVTEERDKYKMLYKLVNEERFRYFVRLAHLEDGDDCIESSPTNGGANEQ